VTTRELHRKAMELFDSKSLRRAMELECQAADSVADRFDLEPTRSVLHRSAATLAWNVGEIQIAKIYVAAGLAGKPPAEIRDELLELRDKLES
jgi:hypothetical protein